MSAGDGTVPARLLVREPGLTTPRVTSASGTTRARLEEGIMRRKWEIPLYVGVGLLLGLGVAAFRNGVLDAGAQAQTGPTATGQKPGQPKKGEPGGVFSPPGT